MSAILSADDLNDFITPGVACIKPVETLPRQRPEDAANPYEVTTEDQAEQAAGAPPAQISLTDCLACSGCVTSAEAVLVSLQSQEEVLNTLNAHPSLSVADAATIGAEQPGKVFVASLSPQARASLAATYGVSEDVAGCMIEQLLCGPQGIKTGGQHGSSFTWVVDTNNTRDISLAASVQEVLGSGSDAGTLQGGAIDNPKTPILASACPGWICYAEKTHPHVLPHLSRLKSPQALTGILLKSILSRKFGVSPDRIWHLAIMPCFDKKLEASREELTDVYWRPEADNRQKGGVRDVDCVITARELLMLAESRGISFPSLSRSHIHMPSFLDDTVDSFLFPGFKQHFGQQQPLAGPSGGYAYYILQQVKTQNPGSEIRVERGRNADVIDYVLSANGQTIAKTARYFGFRNIQNLVRKLKPARQSRLPGARQKALANGRDSSMAEYAYIEVMACPGGCTNGGGQIHLEDLPAAKAAGSDPKKTTPAEQKEWLARVDEAYYSAESSDEECGGEGDAMEIDRSSNGASSQNATPLQALPDRVSPFLAHWTQLTEISLDKLLFTSFRKVESDVGKKSGPASDMDRVAGLASSIGGGW